MAAINSKLIWKSMHLSMHLGLPCSIYQWTGTDIAHGSASLWSSCHLQVTTARLPNLMFLTFAVTRTCPTTAGVVLIVNGKDCYDKVNKSIRNPDAPHDHAWQQTWDHNSELNTSNTKETLSIKCKLMKAHSGKANERLQFKFKDGKTIVHVTKFGASQ